MSHKRLLDRDSPDKNIKLDFYNPKRKYCIDQTIHLNTFELTNNNNRPSIDSKLTDMNINSQQIVKHSFSKQEVDLNTNAASFVKITPQARAKLDKIPNKIGPYECKLCKVVYASAFDLAMHNCPCIFHSEYKCSDCDKVFNSPANLGKILFSERKFFF